MIYLIALLCVLGIAAGQVLFKLGAAALQQSGTIFQPGTFTPLIAALTLYALTTIAWVWVLQKAELGRIYPLMALAFVIVPIGSHFVFGEKFQPQYFLGVAIIMLGIVITVKA